MKTSSITIQREIDAVGGERVAGGDEASLWRLGDGRLVIETNADPVWENDRGFSMLAAEVVCQAGYGWDYRSAEWRQLAEVVDWTDMWPEVDGEACLRGSIVTSGQEGYLNVDEEAMIEEEVARRSAWRVEDGHAKPPSLDQLSAADAFDLRVIGRAEHGGQTWVVFDDGAYRHVVEASHFDACGHMSREDDNERRADDYTAWCGRGFWATDEVAAEVAGLCGLTHVHSAVSGCCGRVDAVEVRS